MHELASFGISATEALTKMAGTHRRPAIVSGPEAQPVKAYLAASVLKLRMEAVDGLARSSRPKEALFISSFFQGGAC